MAIRANDVAKAIDPELADNDITGWAADCAYMSGQFDLALTIHEQQLRYKRERGKDESTSSINTGALLIHFKELDRAEKEIRCFLDRANILGNRRDLGHSDCYLAHINFLRGGLEYRSMFAEGIEHLAFVNDLGALGDFLPLASSAFLPEQPETAAMIQGFADRLVEESGSIRDRLLDLWTGEIAAKTVEAVGPRYEQCRKDGRTTSLEAIRSWFSTLRAGRVDSFMKNPKNSSE